MKRGLSVIVVPDNCGGTVFSVCAMSYPNDLTPVIDFTADNMHDRTLSPDADDNEVVAWIGHAIRRAAALFELELTESPDRPAPWPLQLGLFSAD